MEVAQAQEDVQRLWIESKRRRAELEAQVVDAGELAQMEIKSEITKQVGIVEKKLSTWEETMKK